MRIRKSAGRIFITAGTSAVLGLMLAAQQAKALPVSLGTADDFALLEMGPGSANVSIAQGGNVGFINGDIAIAPDGKLGISAGNFPITGTVYAWQSSGINTGGNAPVVVDLAKVQTAADDAFKASSEASTLPQSIWQEMLHLTSPPEFITWLILRWAIARRSSWPAAVLTCSTLPAA
jgi:hypothetical protein